MVHISKHIRAKIDAHLRSLDGFVFSHGAAPAMTKLCIAHVHDIRGAALPSGHMIRHKAGGSDL